MGTIAQLFESGQRKTDKGLFNNLVMLARVDGKVDDKEVKLLARMANRLSLTEEQVAEIIENPNTYPMTPPLGKEERFERFITFIQMVVADGIVDSSEEILLTKYALALGYNTEQIEDHASDIIAHAKDGLSKEDILDILLKK